MSESHPKALMSTLEDFQILLKDRGLERLIPHAGRLVAPSIRLVLNPWLDPLKGIYPHDGTPLGCSKVGGLPDLPPDFVWPEGKTCALPFLAQFRLEEVSSHDSE